MGGERDLKRLLGSLKAKLQEGVYVFVTVPGAEIPAGLQPRMRFEEDEGTTLIMLRDEAEAFALNYEFPCRMITLEVHSALEAVGFIAHIATILAEQGMGVNPVAGFYHDHLFVPDGWEAEALVVIEEIARANA